MPSRLLIRPGDVRRRGCGRLRTGGRGRQPVWDLRPPCVGFVEAQADGIIQAFTRGGEFLSGTAVKGMVAGGRSLAAFARLLSERCPVLVALPTDHSPPERGMGQTKAHDPRPWGREAEGR